jgi:hypothetical protein
MIHDENPGDQLHLCLKALNTLTYALESCKNDGFAVTCGTIERGLRDTISRIEASHVEGLKSVVS